MSKIKQEHHAIGIAAPQLGVNLRVIVIDFRGKEIAIINPVIKGKKGRCKSIEGCLSVPDWNYEVERPESLIVTGTDMNGIKINYRCTGTEASIIQHEVDHLDGKLINDKGKQAMPKISKEPDKLAWGEDNGNR